MGIPSVECLINESIYIESHLAIINSAEALQNLITILPPTLFYQERDYRSYRLIGHFPTQLLSISRIVVVLISGNSLFKVLSSGKSNKPVVTYNPNLLKYC